MYSNGSFFNKQRYNDDKDAICIYWSYIYKYVSDRRMKDILITCNMPFKANDVQLV